MLPAAVALGGAAACAAAVWQASRLARRPELVHDPGCSFTASVLSRCPTLTQYDYRPVPFLTNAHVRAHAAAAADTLRARVRALPLHLARLHAAPRAPHAAAHAALPHPATGHSSLEHPLQVETIAIAKLRSNPRLPFRREVMLTKDGGAVAIDWEHTDLAEHVRSSPAHVATVHWGCGSGSAFQRWRERPFNGLN
jgi:hypothetical protein